MSIHEEAEAVIRLVGQDELSGTAHKAERAVEAIGGAAEEAKGPISRLKERLESLGKGSFFTEINQGAELLGKAFDYASAAWDGLKEAATDRAVASGFERTFAGAANALGDLQTSTQGLLADGALRQLATQGSRAGLSLQQVSQLLGSSTRAAMAAGRDVRETGEAFLKSVIESNDEAVKQIGVLVDLGSAQSEYARALGTTGDKLTAAQRAQAALGEITQQTDKAFQGITGDAAQAALTRTEARWQSLTAAVREFALGMVVATLEPADAATTYQTKLANDVAAFGNAALDAAVKGDYSQASIDRLVKSMRVAGNVQEAYTLQTAYQARAAAQLASEEAALDAVFRERAEALARIESAERSRLNTLRDTVLGAEQTSAATVQNARDLALMADSLGFAQQGGERWVTVLRTLGDTHLSAADDVLALYGAIRSSNSEMAKAIELQAELAAAAGDLATADALRSQAVGLATGETGGQAKPSRGGGGGRRKDPNALQPETQRALERARDQAMTLQRAAVDFERQTADRRAEEARAAEELVWAARLEAFRAGQEEMQAMRDQAWASASSAAGAIGQNFSVGAFDLGGLSAAVEGLRPLMGQFEQLGAASKAGGAAMTGSVAGIVGASGKIAAGLIKDQRAQAGVMALVETAESIRSFAFQDYLGGGLHAASAVMYGVVAGGGSKGGGGGGGGSGPTRGMRDIPRVPNDAPPTTQSAAPISITVAGGTFLGTDTARVGREITRIIEDHQSRAFRGRAN